MDSVEKIDCRPLSERIFSSETAKIAELTKKAFLPVAWISVVGLCFAWKKIVYGSGGPAGKIVKKYS